MELFRRFPKIHPLSHEKQELVPQRDWNQYPAFSEDFETLERELMPYFRELDDESLRRQNRYRWMYVILIFGGAGVTILGILQLAFINVSWIGISEAGVAALLGLATAGLQRLKDHEHYLNARLAAERLRSEYFMFLGRCGQYVNERNRIQKLIQLVADIKAKGEYYESE